MSLFSQARFLAAAADLAQLPEEGPPEIAFVGRSNVGKSSAINALARRRRLAFVSKTPGRTQALNFFELGGAGRLVDLPGYGYAKVPKPLRERWEPLVGGYLAQRATLAGVVVVMDARHPLTPLDRQLLDWIEPFRRPALFLLAKADKLKRAQRSAALAEVRRARPREEAVLFSSLTREGVDAAREALEGWLARAAEIKNPR